MARAHGAAATEVNSWDDVQREEKAILTRLHANPALMLAFAANPLLALQELGYEIHADHKQEFEDRLRFGSHFEQVGSLRKKIFSLAGKPFELHSAAALHAALSTLLEKEVARTLTSMETAPLYFFRAAGTEITDPLERIRDAHHIMKPLLQYRRIEAGAPPFATPEVYHDIRHGKRVRPFTNMTVRLGKAHK